MKGTLLTLLLLCGAVDLSGQAIVQQFAAISSGAGEMSDLGVPNPTANGNTIIVMPGQLSPGATVLSITDDAPEGSNTYKKVSAATSSCPTGPLEIWYCEKCNPGVTELKFHLSGHVKGSINTFLEVSNLSLTSVLDGSGVQVSDGTATNAGIEVGPSIKTTATDFVVARYFSVTPPTPSGVTPATWTHRPSYVYTANAAAGTYQPTLQGAKPGSKFCMSVAAFKIADSQ
jgi:hypothetical protein